MRWYGKEITVARGETFSLTCKITNEDGVPYMISSNLENPTFLLTVANTLYKSDDKRYVLKCWTPLVLNSMNDAIEVTTLVGATDTTKLYLLTQQVVISDVTYDVGYYTYNGSTWDRFNEYVNGYVFNTFEIGTTDLTTVGEARKLYKSTTDGKYYIYDAGEWKSYETIFMQNFPSSVTKEWYSKNFYYELRLVAGEFTDEFEQALLDNAVDQYTANDSNPFKKITDEFVVIPKTQLNVLSRLGGYNG